MADRWRRQEPLDVLLDLSGTMVDASAPGIGCLALVLCMLIGLIGVGISALRKQRE